MKLKFKFYTSNHQILEGENTAIWLAAIVGLSLSLAALLLIQQQLETHRLLEFEWVAHNRTRALNHGLDNSLLAVETLRDHLIASGTADGDKIRAFADSLLDSLQGVDSFVWVPRIEASKRREFEANPISIGGGLPILEFDGSNQLIPATVRAEFFPVSYLAPKGYQGFTSGLDLSSIPDLAAMLDRARYQGRTTMSGRIGFPSENGGTVHGFLVASPLFASSSGAPTTDLIGYVVGLFRWDELSKVSVALLEPRGVEVLIEDRTVPEDKRFLHFYASRLSPKNIQSDDYLEWLNLREEPKVEELVRVADRQLAIISGRTAQFRSAEAFQEGPWIALIAGLLFTILLSFYLARIREHNSQRWTMEQQLAEREELFRQITETVDEAFWATTAEGNELLYLSPTYSKMLGVTKDEQPPLLLDTVHPEDRHALAKSLENTGRDGTDTDETHRLRRTDGVMRWVRTRAFPVRDTQGKIYRKVGFIEDITEQKLANEALRASEAKLRELFFHSPDIIMTVDVSGKILLMNRSVPELPAERAIGHSCLALMPREFRKSFRKELKKAFSKRITRRLEYGTEDGTYWEGRIAPILNTDGEATAAMVIAADITEKRNLQAQAQHRARLASIGELAAGVAHEVNNPNNAIHFNASIVARAWHDIMPILNEYAEENGDFALGGLSFSEAGDNIPQLLSEINHNSDRIRRIVKNLKRMSRQDAGELTEILSIQEILEATAMILRSQIQKYTDVFRMEISDELPSVRGSAQQLEQVFLNVILNALQALPDRSKGVFIDILVDADDGMLRIVVRDEGSGISESDLGRLTEPFFTARTNGEGTGLGLSISRSIVEAHGGNMLFVSTPGLGTTVTILIPVIQQS
ncbi:PAS domain S-box protein [Pseudomonadota bacterium]